MKFIVITTEPFPNGLAATNRIKTYVTNFNKFGLDTLTLIIKSTENPEHIFNKKSEGSFNGSRFNYTNGTTIRAKSIIGRRLQSFYGILKATNLLVKERPDFVLCYFRSVSISFWFFVVSKILAFIYIKEESETPNLYFYGSFVYRSNIIKKIYLKYYYKLFDGLFLMTSNLVNLLSAMKRKNAFTLKIPMTVELNRFEVMTHNPLGNLDYILYIGNLNQAKDGVTTLVDSFNMIASEFNKIKLVLIGNPISSEYLLSIKKCIAKYRLEERVIFIERLANEEIISYINNARVLALARPNSEQSFYGFPTKLGEYLASGKPVVVTKVGEINEYLTDGFNAYLAEPDNAESFATKLREALTDFNISETVGQNGKQTAREKFNGAINTKIAYDYLVKTKMKKK